MWSAWGNLACLIHQIGPHKFAIKTHPGTSEPSVEAGYNMDNTVHSEHSTQLTI